MRSLDAAAFERNVQYGLRHMQALGTLAHTYERRQPGFNAREHVIRNARHVLAYDSRSRRAHQEGVARMQAMRVAARRIAQRRFTTGNRYQDMHLRRNAAWILRDLNQHMPSAVRGMSRR